MLILGLDLSSTCLGYALSTGAAWGHHDLTGEIDDRCAQAREAVAGLLDTHRPAVVIIESPVARFARAVIPQARVSGAVLSLLSERQALWQEVAPSVAKRVLCGDGAATKAEMVEAAAARLGIAGVWRKRNGKIEFVANHKQLLTEDEADAYALALCGAAMRVERSAA